jgi:hypothetical protein
VCEKQCDRRGKRRKQNSSHDGVAQRTRVLARRFEPNDLAPLAVIGDEPT